MTQFLVKNIRTVGDLSRVFPNPMPFFKKGEFRRYRSVFMDAEWWDGSCWSRGATPGGAGLIKGLPPCERKHTDYSVEDGKVILASHFYKEEFSIKKQRHRKSIVIKDFAHLVPLFNLYLELWNHLVDLDQQGQHLGKDLLKRDPKLALAFAETPFYASKTLKEYLSRRSRSKTPLRYKSLHRLNSIPMALPNHPELASLISDYLKPLGLDLRRVVSSRLVRKSDKRFLVSFIFTISDVIKEVNLDDSSLNYCRDPRLVDIGCSFSSKGLSIVVQNAFEDREFFTVSTDVLEKTKNFLDSFLKEISGKVRSISLDGSSVTPNNLLEVKKELSRRCRTLKAVGAAEFYVTPRLVSLGEQYPKDTPFYDSKHLKVWERKLLSDNADYATIMGLTGAPCLVKYHKNSLVTSSGNPVIPEVMANHALQLALAKYDMWHGATFMDRGTCRTVRKGLDRSKEKVQQKASVFRS